MSVNLSPQICESKLKPIYLIPLLRNLGGEKFIVFASSVANSPKTLKAFRGKGHMQVLVCSDAMTSGMDVERAAYIKTYIHRAGPRARAGQNGHCFTLLPKDEDKLLYMFQVKRFKKLLQQADHDSCPVHSIPSSSIESLRPIYKSEYVESQANRKRKIGFKLSRMVKG
ncbi:hypothetical protein CISIN_1g048509mg [Citrus sinensis]|uniref:Helicase C-terminal domain-containing protein n=1 Tax=Citrus sinensis TaxID=2711 RepID=A0A067GIZ5_CITSI|nr:hypothetical protein CISIN_1g048509mg [Citrus sinensis]